MLLQTFLEAERGRAVALAKALTKSQSFIWQLAKGSRPVPGELCPGIEKATKGALSCEQLRSDLTWVRIPDSAWEWNPSGRPLRDDTGLASSHVDIVGRAPQDQIEPPQPDGSADSNQPAQAGGDLAQGQALEVAGSEVGHVE